MNIESFTTGFQATKLNTSVPKPALVQALTAPDTPTTDNEPKTAQQTNAPKLPPKELQEKVNRLFERQNTNLSLNFDLEQSGAIRAVQLLDPATKEVILQFPNEAVLQVRKNLEKMLQEDGTQVLSSGLLLSEKA